jgi:hypothetical protein
MNRKAQGAAAFAKATASKGANGAAYEAKGQICLSTWHDWSFKGLIYYLRYIRF